MNVQQNQGVFIYLLLYRFDKSKKGIIDSLVFRGISIRLVYL